MHTQRLMQNCSSHSTNELFAETSKASCSFGITRIKKFNSNSLEIDGKFIPSKVFFRKDACQWVEIDEEMLAKVA